jgi:hypothetical protein
MEIDKPIYHHYYVRNNDSFLSYSEYALDYDDLCKNNSLYLSSSITFKTHIDKVICSFYVNGKTGFENGFALNLHNKTYSDIKFGKTNIPVSSNFIPIRDNFILHPNDTILLVYSSMHRGFVKHGNFTLYKSLKSIFNHTYYDAYYTSVLRLDKKLVCIDDLEFYRNIEELTLINCEIKTITSYKTPNKLRNIFIRNCKYDYETLYSLRNVDKIYISGNIDMHIINRFLDNTVDEVHMSLVTSRIEPREKTVVLYRSEPVKDKYYMPITYGDINLDLDDLEDLLSLGLDVDNLDLDEDDIYL